MTQYGPLYKIFGSKRHDISAIYFAAYMTALIPYVGSDFLLTEFTLIIMLMQFGKLSFFTRTKILDRVKHESSHQVSRWKICIPGRIY